MVLELNIFQKKLENLLDIKILQRIFIEYRHMIRQCVDTFGFIDFMLKGKSLVDYTNLFSPNNYEKTDRTILKHFQ